MALPPPPRWLSPTAARDRCLDRSFSTAGMRRAAAVLSDGATVALWVPPDPSPSRPALLLLHGFGARATWQWAPFIRPLLAAGFDPYIPDLLFFGDSYSPKPDRSDTYQARSIIAAMEQIGVTRFGLAGISYGGFVAYQIAAMWPAAVERVVLVCAGVCLEERDLAAGLFAVSDISEAAALLLPQRPEELRRLMRLTFSRPPRIMPSCFIRDYIRIMCTDNVKEKTELLHALINGRKLSDLPTINQPTLIIWGEQDRVFPLELGFRLKRLLGENSQLVVIPNAGHAINREKPRELCKFMMDYFVDSSVKYYDDGRKGSWKNILKRFAGASIKRVDSGRPLL